MDEKRYNVVFRGRIKDGQEIARVKESLMKRLKMDPNHLERLFSGKRVVIKKNADLETCEKLKSVFDQAGALCDIEEPGTLPQQAAAPPAGEASGHETPPPLPPRTLPPEGDRAHRGPDEKFCDRCGGIVKMNALTCPYCEKKFERRKMGCLPKAAIGLAVGLILLIVIGILAAIAVPQFMTYRHRAHEAALKTELAQLVQAERIYHQNHGVYAPSLAALDYVPSVSEISLEIISADQNCFEAVGTHGALPDNEVWADCNGLKHM